MKEQVQQWINPLALDANHPEHQTAFQSYRTFYNLNTLPASFGKFIEVKPYNIWVHTYFSKMESNSLRDANKKNSKGTVFIVHGYFDHSAMYKNIIEQCLDLGLDVVLYDLPGHGLSSGARVEINDFFDYQRILRAVVYQAQKHTMQTPFYAIGQSTGGGILIDHLLSDAPDLFEKVVLLAPLVRTYKHRKITLLHKALKRITDSVPRRFKPYSTHDEAFGEFIAKKDPLQSRRVSAKWIGAMLEWSKQLHGRGHSSKNILVVQGSKDSTVDMKYNNKFLQQRFKQMELTIIDGAFHNLVAETEFYRQSMHSAIASYFSKS